MIELDAFFDIETTEWDQFVLGGLIDKSGSFYCSEDPEDFYSHLVSIKGTCWSWNGGLFDNLWAIDMARKAGHHVRISAAGTRVTRALLRGNCCLRDAVALVPMSLSKAAGIAGIQIAKDTGLPCSKRCKLDRKSLESCGGYCSIKRGMAPSEMRLLLDYLRLDVEGGWQIMRAVIDSAKSFGFQLRGTVGASSYATMAQWCRLEPACWEWRHFKRARSAYFGGRCQVFRPSAVSGHRYDIHSAYPAALSTTRLPVGEAFEAVGARARRAYLRQKEGVYTAVVTVHGDTFIPPLPWRLGGRRDGRGSRICYPVGTFRGTWTRIELEYAESLGHDVEIVSGLIWEDAETILKPFVDKVWEYRAQAGTSTAMGKWLKWFANSATGKLAESPYKDQIYLHPDHDKIKHCQGSAGPRGADNVGHWGCTDEKCTGACGKWKMLDRVGELWAQPIFRIPANGHVHWAAYLTASTRVTWHKMAVADGQGGRTAVYGDTDSVFATIPRDHNIGPELGQWGSDGPFHDFIAVAPKCYKYVDSATAKEAVRAKGLSGISPDDFQRFLRGGHTGKIVRDRGVMGLRSAARAGDRLFIRKMISRSNRADGIHFGDRVLRSDGLTYPQTTKELTTWLKS